MAEAGENAVTRWFGPQFGQLHPLLQDLHRHGGLLRGAARIKRGRGIAGWIGGRLLRKFGLPPRLERCSFEVEIRHQDEVLHWNRRFGAAAQVCSRFVPSGVWPDGYWTEHTGPARFDLAVDVIDGGWYWRCLRVYLAGLRLPLWLFPRAEAYKCIEQGKYRFSVKFSLPLLGMVLAYSGALDALSTPSTSGKPLPPANHE